jgi:cyclohexanone monooxygenase
LSFKGNCTTPVRGRMRVSTSPACAWGVIGTGSSGVQSIPIIARQAKHLTVFQRPPISVCSARNVPMPPDKERAHKAEYPARRRAAYDTPFGIAGYPPPVKSAPRNN